ncbi:hypothetical protein Salat_1426800 [Sesamum alatum]|uniref:Uncharacterized protein n=1 Tax=Sesamum alatum TaxID=300844 RepID=A0AAE1YAU2_9LAMI|nr:hypothetical protein Salat_1426800 [Sesamum alatum]
MSNRESDSNGKERRTWGTIRWPRGTNRDAKNLPHGEKFPSSKNMGGRGGEVMPSASPAIQAEAMPWPSSGRGISPRLGGGGAYCLSLVCRIRLLSRSIFLRGV